jgi:hypothetical protein
MTATQYHATTWQDVGTSIVEQMMTTGVGHTAETQVEGLKNKTEGTGHSTIQTGVVLLMCGPEEDTMATVTKMIMLEKELSAFMEGAEENRSVLLQSRKRTESHNHS